MRERQTDDEVVTTKLVRGPDARPQALETSGRHKRRAAASAPVIVENVPSLDSDAPPAADSRTSGPKPTLEAPIRQVPRAVRGTGGADEPVEETEEHMPDALPLIARKVPGLAKPIAMSVQNPGRQGFSIFRKR
jgi:hypothetical protein